MRKFLFAAALLAAVALVPQTASATPIDGAYISFENSWTLHFNNNSGTQVYRMEAFVVSNNATFEAPAGSSFQPWAGTVVNPYYFAAQGGAVGPSFGVSLIFNDPRPPSGDNVVVDLYFYNQANAVVDSFRILNAAYPGEWGSSGAWYTQGVGWNLIPGTPTYERAAVPEPATLSLLGLGLVGVARAARRKKQ